MNWWNRADYETLTARLNELPTAVVETRPGLLCLRARPLYESNDDEAAAEIEPTPFVAPATPLEARVAQVWAEVPGVERLGLDFT